MTTTPEQLRDLVANELGLLRLGQALQDQDKVRIESAYRHVHAALTTEKLITHAVSDAMPDDIVPVLISLVAEACANTYGVSEERLARIKLAVAEAPSVLRRLLASGYSGHTELQKFLDQVAASLGVSRVGQPLRAEHAEIISNGYVRVFNTLKEDGLTSWGVDLAPPYKLWASVGALVAEACLPPLRDKIAPEVYQEIKLESSDALRQLMKLQQQPHQSKTTEVDY